MKYWSSVILKSQVTQATTDILSDYTTIIMNVIVMHIINLLLLLLLLFWPRIKRSSDQLVWTRWTLQSGFIFSSPPSHSDQLSVLQISCEQWTVNKWFQRSATLRVSDKVCMHIWFSLKDFNGRRVIFIL